LESGGYVVISLVRYRDEKEFGKSAFDAFMEVEPIDRSLVMRNWSDFIFQPNIKADSSADLLESLSRREREVALMILKGYSNEAIALNLAISARETIGQSAQALT